MKTFLFALSLTLASLTAAWATEAPARSLSGAELEYIEKNGCYLNICVGQGVQVIAGRWAGHGGVVTALNPVIDQVTVRNSAGLLLYPRFSEVRPLTQPVRCYWNLCLGDTVQIVSGLGAGQVGRVDSLNPQAATVGVVTNFGQRYFPNITQVRKVAPGPQCYAQICVGHRVRVVTGRYAGFAGQVMAVAPNGVLTVRAPNGVTGFPTAFEVQRLP